MNTKNSINESLEVIRRALEDEKNISIKSIKLSESLYKITSIGEKYAEYLAQEFIKSDLS